MDRLLTATAAAEDQHFWFVAMRRFTRQFLDDALRRAGLSQKKIRIIDCGAGTGRNLDWLSEYGSAVGVELSPTGLAVGRARHRKMIRGTVAALPYPDNTFDLATSFDVIYSLDNETERRALVEMHRVVKPGGVVLVNAAALDILKGKHSALALEERRYSSAMLRERLTTAGFDVLRVSYTNFLTFPLTLGVRLVQRASGAGDQAGETEMAVPAAPVNALLSWGLGLEAAALRVVPMPAGSSVLAVGIARK